MPIEITMPQLSDTMTDGKLIKWYKKEGDKVKNGDKLADVETDKAVMEMEALDSGTLAAVLIGEGQSVPVGGVMGLLATAKEDPADVKKTAGSGQKSGGAAASASATSSASTTVTAPAKAVAAESSKQVGSTQQNISSSQSSATAEMREPDNVGHGATRETLGAVPPLPHKADNGHERLKITPVAKRIAGQSGIDVNALEGRGSGPGGRIVKEDVLKFQQSPAAASAEALPARPGSGEKQVIPLSKMRAAIAKGLQASKQNIPHFYETIDADVEELTALRARVNEILEPQKIRLSLSDFLTKAVAVSLLRHPALNATFNGTEITRYGDVHLGIAVAVPDGLIVPVLKNVHLMAIREI